MARRSAIGRILGAEPAVKKAASAETMGAPSRLPHIATMPGLARAFRIWAGDASIAHLPDVPGADEGERHLLACLGGVAAALAGERVGAWPTPVNSWALAGPRPPEELMEAVREGLGRRVDPLAVLYDACISAANRRRLGTVFTPTPVVNHMIGLTGKYLDRAPAVIVDPGAGVGAFSIAAARRWPSSRVLAVDVNVVTLGLLEALCRIRDRRRPTTRTGSRAYRARPRVIISTTRSSLRRCADRHGGGHRQSAIYTYSRTPCRGEAADHRSM